MLTNYQLADILDRFGGYYLALSTTEPSRAGENFTEPSGMGYSRVYLYGCLDSVVVEGEESYRKNSNKEIHFDEATGDWGEISWFGVYDSKNNGKLMYYGKILDQEGSPTTIHPVANRIAIIRKGQLKIALKSVEE